MKNKEDKENSIFNISKISGKNIITRYDKQKVYFFILINIKTCNGFTRKNNGIVQISFIILGTNYTYYSYVRPPDDIPWIENNNFYDTNETKKNVEYAPLLQDVIKEFYNIITMDNMIPIIIAHNASFDKDVLEYWFSKYNLQYNNIYWCNTMNSSFFNIKDKNGKNIKSLKNIAKTFYDESDYDYINFNNSKKYVEILNYCLLKLYDNNEIINIAFSNKYNTENNLKIKKEKINNKCFILEFNSILNNIKEFQQIKSINKKTDEVSKLLNKYKNIVKNEKKILRDKENIKKEIKNILKNKNITDVKIDNIINKTELDFL